MLLLGKEGALGTAQSIGAIIAAIIMYVVGRLSSPRHRIFIFAAGVSLFALGAILNGILFNQVGVVLFILLLLIAKPLMDLAYFPIQFRVIDIVSKIEKRGEFAYILNHEAGLYTGRFLGAGTFLLLAYTISTEVALRYAIVIIGLLQLYSVIVAKGIIARGKLLTQEDDSLDAKVLENVATELV
jgi:YQGE family putative transporter